MSVHDFGGVLVSVETDVLAYDLFWEGRKEEFHRKRNSIKMYEDLSPEQRVVIYKKMKHVLSIMIDNLPEWLPVSFSAEQPGEALKLEFTLGVGDIDEDITDTYNQTSLMLEESAKEIIAMLSNWEDEELGPSNEA